MTITLDTDPMTTHSDRVPILPVGPVDDIKVNRSAIALLNDIERQLEHFVYGRYESMQCQALGRVFTVTNCFIRNCRKDNKTKIYEKVFQEYPSHVVF